MWEAISTLVIDPGRITGYPEVIQSAVQRSHRKVTHYPVRGTNYRAPAVCLMLSAEEIQCLEAEDGAEGDLQIVVRSAVEVDVVAGIQPQPHWTEMSLDAQARVEHAADVL